MLTPYEKQMHDVLLEAVKVFHAYAESHHAKRTPEGRAKARRNEDMASKCLNALVPPKAAS